MTAQRAPSIRTTLLLIFSVLTLLIALQAGFNVLKQWQQLSKIETLQEATRLSDKLFAAIETLSIERDIASTLLRSSDAETIRTLSTRLPESREQTNETMQAAMQALNLYSFSELTDLQEKIATGFANIQSLRKKIDEDIAHPQTTRNKALAKQWQDDTSSLTAQTPGFMDRFHRTFYRYPSRGHPAPSLPVLVAHHHRLHRA